MVFKKIYSEYKQKIANINTINDKSIKNAKVAIVMNCQIFRFWESMFKSSLM